MNCNFQQENPGVESFTRKPKRKEIDSGDSACDCSQQQCSPSAAKREDECQNLDEQMNKIPIGESAQSFCKPKMETVELDQTVKDEITENQSSNVEEECSCFGFDGDIMEFASAMDCTDSQLVNVQDSSCENLIPESHKRNTR